MGVSFPAHYKTFYFLYNIVYFTIGVVMVAIGVSSFIDIQSLGNLTQQDFIAASGIFIAVGGLKIIFSIMAEIIYFIKFKPLFAIYVIASILLMLLTFTAAIIAFLSRRDAYNTLDARLQTIYDRNVTDDIIDVQDTLDCCGPDRMFNNSVVPCISGRPANTLNGQGCLQFASDVVVDNLYNLGAIGMAFGSFELTTFLVVIQHTEGSGL